MCFQNVSKVALIQSYCFVSLMWILPSYGTFVKYLSLFYWTTITTLFNSDWFRLIPRKLGKIFLKVKSSEISKNFKMSDTDGSKSHSEIDDETYGSKSSKRKRKQKVNYTFILQWQCECQFNPNAPVHDVWNMIDL